MKKKTLHPRGSHRRTMGKRKKGKTKRPKRGKNRRLNSEGSGKRVQAKTLRGGWLVGTEVTSRGRWPNPIKRERG